ncbi:MAG TPA: hypothetical protein EYN66_24910, partial [Myxococcales bacterium]|nr:hypothetical protein [Myxococcales bacterium]
LLFVIALVFVWTPVLHSPRTHRTPRRLGVSTLLEQLTQTVHFRYQIGNPDDIIEGTDDGSDDVGTDDVGADDVGGDDMGSGGTGETPFEAQNLQIDVKKDSEWGTGYCSTIKVTNLSYEMLTWKFKLKVDGSINQIWNASTIPIAGSEELFFVGVDWNGQLAPSASAEFGFCAAL